MTNLVVVLVLVVKSKALYYKNDSWTVRDEKGTLGKVTLTAFFVIFYAFLRFKWTLANPGLVCLRVNKRKLCRFILVLASCELSLKIGTLGRACIYWTSYDKKCVFAFICYSFHPAAPDLCTGHAPALLGLRNSFDERAFQSHFTPTGFTFYCYYFMGLW